MKQKRVRLTLLKFTISLIALLALGYTGPASAKVGAGRTFSDQSQCLAECEAQMSDCLGNTGGDYSCIEQGEQCRIGCYERTQ
jgi:hypothetical protein